MDTFRAAKEGFIFVFILIIARSILTELRNLIGSLSRDQVFYILLAFVFISSIWLVFNKAKKLTIVYGILMAIAVLFFSEAGTLGLFVIGMVVLFALPFAYHALPFSKVE